MRLVGTIVLCWALGVACLVGGALSATAPRAEAISLAQAAGCSASSTSFVAVLNGNQEVPTLPAGVSGIANLSLNTVTNQLTVSINATGLTAANVTLAHIHSPAPVGTNAGVDTNLFLGPTGTFVLPFNTTVTVTPALIASMQAGTAYVNIHTVANGGGEIRGQIACGPAVLPPSAATTSFVAVLNGAQEVPPNTSGGQGVATVVLDATLSNATITVNVAGITLTTIQRLHIHSPAGPGVNAGITVDYYNNGTPPFANPFVGTLPVTPAVVSALQSGNAYVNVHTTGFAGGEIRGQLGAAGAVAPTPTPTPVIPEPLPLWLFGSGLMALGFFAYRQRRR